MAETEVLGNREAEEDPSALGDVRDAESRARARRGRREIVAVERNAAGDGLDDPRHHAQGRRLPCAVGAQQRDHLAGVDGDADVADHRRLVVARGQSLDLERDAHEAPGSVLASPAATSAPALPRYAVITFGSPRTTSGAPCAITLPNSSTTT